MAQDKTSTHLPSMTDIWIVTGVSGLSGEINTWNVCAYSEQEYALKAQKFLQKLANKLDNNDQSSSEFKRDYEELKLHDRNAFYNFNISYYVDPLKLVV